MDNRLASFNGSPVTFDADGDMLLGRGLETVA